MEWPFREIVPNLKIRCRKKTRREIAQEIFGESSQSETEEVGEKEAEEVGEKKRKEAEKVGEKGEQMDTSQPSVEILEDKKVQYTMCCLFFMAIT